MRIPGWKNFLKGICFVVSGMIVSIHVSADASAIYHTSKSYQIGAQSYDQLLLNVNDKTLQVRGCANCQPVNYRFHTLASKISGKNTYKLSKTDYIIEENKGVYVWTQFPEGLGKSRWSSKNPYSVFSTDESQTTLIAQNKKAQKRIKKSIFNYSKEMCKEYQKRKTENMLPRIGLLMAFM